MDVAGLQPRYFLGFRSNVKNNVDYLTDNDIVYPIGGVLTVHNFNLKSQKFIRLPEKGLHINLMCVSPNKKVIAIAERGEPPIISIYDAVTLRRKRQISAPVDKGVTAKAIECMTFTFESKNLIVIYGDPDWTMFSYRYERGKIDSYTHANNSNNTGVVRDIACNPNDATVVVVVGDVLFRLLAVTESIWRQYGYSKSEMMYFRCVTWLSQERLVTGTMDGRLMMVENGELKAVYQIDEAMTLNMFIKDELQSASATMLLSNIGSIRSSSGFLNEVRCIISFPKGFAVECGIGRVHVYEKEGPHIYKKRNIFKLEDPNPELNENEQEPANRINTMTVSPSQDYLIVSSDLQQLYYAYLWGPDITKIPEGRFLELGPPIHRGAIQDVAVCIWKPTLITVGKDRTIRVWNYETMDFIFYKSYQEDIYGVTLHPTGLFVLVGFSGKLKLFGILIDDFKIIREFSIRYCAVCSFSTLGHLFGAVNGNIIQIYTCGGFENITNLKGHNGKITSICWSKLDDKMVSCGTEGAVYEWDIRTGKRLIEVFEKTCSFTAAFITTDGKIHYAIGSDGEVKEIVNGDIRTTQAMDATGLVDMTLSHSDQMLFLTSGSGSVYSLKLPLMEKGDFLEFSMHNCAVTRIEISFDDKYVITCSTDGCMCIWKLVNTAGRAIKIDKDYQVSQDILIPFTDLEDKIESIKELNARLHELDREHLYQIRQLEAKHGNKLIEVHEAYKEAIEELKDKNNTLESDHMQEIQGIRMDITNMRESHERDTEQLETTFNEKLITEYNKYTLMEEKLVKTKTDYELILDDLRNEKIISNAQITEDFLQKLHDKDILINDLRDEIERQTKDHEIMKQQIEDDADREIYEMKTAHEKDLKEEQTNNVQLRAENGILRKKITVSQKDIDELKHTVFTMENEHVKFKSIIADLERDILELKNEINERDETIQEKEKRIFNLKKQTQELEKHKYVLEFKINELKAQIEPRERRIYDQKEQINDMISELEILQEKITSLALQLEELRAKLNSSHNEYKREQARFRQACELIKSMRSDLHRVSGMIQDPNKMKLAIKDMYHKYNADKEFVITREEDCDVKSEFQKQRWFLEKTVGGLKDAIARKRVDKSQDKLKIIEESAELITETNKLRTQLKLAQKRNRQMESVLGLSKKVMPPREAQKRLADAVKTREDIHAEYKNILEMDEKCIDSLKNENSRLTEKLLKTQHVYTFIE